MMIRIIFLLGVLLVQPCYSMDSAFLGSWRVVVANDEECKASAAELRRAQLLGNRNPYARMNPVVGFGPCGIIAELLGVAPYNADTNPDDLPEGVEPRVSCKDDTLMHLAAREHDWELLQQAVANFPIEGRPALSDLTRKNSNGEAPLHLLAANRLLTFLYHEEVRCCFSSWEKIGIDQYGNTVLHYVVACPISPWDHTPPKRIIEVLKCQGNIVNLPNAQGATALHLACAALLPLTYVYQPNNGSLDYGVIPYLLAQGADVRAIDNKGRTPLDCLLLGLKQFEGHKKKYIVPGYLEEIFKIFAFYGVTFEEVREVFSDYFTTHSSIDTKRIATAMATSAALADE